MRFVILALLAILLIPVFTWATPQPGVDYAINQLNLKLTTKFNGTLHKLNDGTVQYPTGNPTLDTLMKRCNIPKLVPVFTWDPASLNNHAFWEVGLDRIYTMYGGLEKPYPFGTELVTDVCDRLVKYSGVVEEANPTAYGYTTHTPNDWSLFTRPMWGLDSMHCREAWEYARGQTGSQILAVTIDTGVDIYHPDLVDNFLVNAAEDLNHNGRFDDSDMNGIDDDGNGYVDDVVGWDAVNHDTYWMIGYHNVPGEDYGPRDGKPMDVEGHGTHVCGTIASRTNNGIGVPSASYNVKTLAVRAGFAVYHDGGLTGSFNSVDVSAGVQYAVARGARVVSLSLGGTWSDLVYRSAGQYARMCNCLPFAAAGNDSSSDANYPSEYSYYMSVAALDRGNELAHFSNFRESVDLCAPGVEILSTVIHTATNLGYGLKSGTSMACPNAAAVAALALSKAPEMTDDDLASMMISTARDPSGWNPNYVGRMGRIVDAKALVSGMRSMLLTSPNFTSMNLAIGDYLGIYWNSAINVSTARVELNRNYPTGAWEVISGDGANMNFRSWVVTGPSSDHVRIRILDSNNPTTIGDTMRVDMKILAQRALPYREEFVANQGELPPSWLASPYMGGFCWFSFYNNPNSNNGVVGYPTNMAGPDRYFLWSPNVSTLGATTVTVRFDFCMSNEDLGDQEDSLFVAYSTNNLYTETYVGMRRVNGVGNEQLLFGSGGDAMNPASTGWGTWTITLPADAANQNSLRVGLFGTNYARTRSIIFVDNFELVAYAPPYGPSNLQVTGLATNYVALNWSDNSNNETGFKIMRSTDGTNFTQIGTTATNIHQYTDFTAMPGYSYTYRVYSMNGPVASSEFSDVFGAPNCMVPQAPVVDWIGTNQCKLTVRNDFSNINGPETMFRIFFTNQSTGVTLQVQLNGTLGLADSQRPMHELENLKISGLLPGVTYSVGVRAVSPAWNQTDLSTTVECSTVPGYSIPFDQSFEQEVFPPLDWELPQTTSYTVLWEAYASETENYHAACFPANNPITNNQMGMLLGPYVDLRDVALANIYFQWSYALRDADHDDILYVFATIDNGATLEWLWQGYGTGVGGAALVAGSGGAPDAPATRSTWREVMANLPAYMMGRNDVRIGFIGQSFGGSNIYISPVSVNRVFGPNAPVMGQVVSHDYQSAQIAWHDQAYNETGFRVFQSTDSLNWNFLQILPANDTIYNAEWLTPNMHYWFKIYAMIDALPSDTCEFISFWTYPALPDAPTYSFVSCSTAIVSPQNSSIAYNPDETQYAILEQNNNLYLQNNCTLGENPEWKNLAQWGRYYVTGLHPNTEYIFVTVARNGAGEITPTVSDRLYLITKQFVDRPCSTGFSSEYFPPLMWEYENPDGGYMWSQYTGFNSNDGVAMMDCYHNSVYDDRDVLWTPFIDLSAGMNAELRFKWSYSPYGSFNDSVEVVYQSQFGTSTVLFRKWATGTGEEALASGSGGSSMVPAAAGTWREAVISIPQMLLDYCGRIGFVSINRNGAAIFIDDISVTQASSVPPTVPGNLTISFALPNATLSWDAATGTFDTYRIWRNSTGYFAPPDVGSLIGTVPVGTNTYIDNNVTGHYYYRVTAYRSASSSSVQPVSISSTAISRTKPQSESKK